MSLTIGDSKVLIHSGYDARYVPPGVTADPREPADRADLQRDPPRPAFQIDFIDTPGRSYDVSPDGKRLLVVTRAEPDVRNRINILTNWTEALERSAR